MSKLKKTAKAAVKDTTTKRTRWEDEDDFEKDLYSISDFGQPFKNHSPPSVYVRKARTKSIYDADDDLHSEHLVPTSCGRGRSLLMNSRAVRNSTFLKQQAEISQDIRLSSNGYGYCNDRIEQALNCNASPPRPSPPIPPALTNGATPRLSTPSKVTNRPLMPLCDILRNGMRAKQEEADPDKPIDINSLKEFPKL